MRVNQLKCKTLADVIHLTKESMKEAGIDSELMLKFPKRLKETIQSKHDYEIIAAMGIPDVGPAKAKLLLKNTPLKKLARIRFSDSVRLAMAVMKTNNLHVVTYLSNKEFTDEIQAIIDVGYIESDNFDRVKVGHTGGA